MKQKALLIAEKPSVMRDIQNAYMKIKDKYPYDIDFGCCAGHLLSLCDPDEYKEEWGKPWRKDALPIIPETWKKKVVNEKFFKTLKDMWEHNHYDLIINAGDAGREGQLIQHLVYEALGVNVPVLRFWADDTTEKTIIKTLNNLKPDSDFQGLTDASYLRLFFDWLCGINFSRSATLSLGRVMRVGRVMSATLALVVNREKEILDFKPVDFFEISAGFTTGEKNYKGTLLNPNAPENAPTMYAFMNKQEAEAVLKEVSGISSGEITDITEEDKVTRPPALFNLTDLQKECATKYNFSPAKTLSVAQSLYEKHFLSYPRTESKCLTTEQAKTIPTLLQKLKALSSIEPFITHAETNGLIEKVLSSKKYVDNKKVSDHPALTPTDVIPDAEALSKDEKLVYMLVICRFLAIFLEDYISTHTTVITSLKNGKFNFRSTGVVEKQKGWKKILELISTQKNTDTQLPSLSKGEAVNSHDYELNSKQTTPPPRYNDSTLLTAMETAGKQLTDKELEKVLMECSGLGTPATRAEIIDKLFKYEYLTRKSKTIYPTEQGMEYISLLSGRTIISPELTAVWEKKLKEVETGTITYEQFYNAMVKYVTSEVGSLLTLKNVGQYHKVVGKCPKCNRPFSAYDNFYACDGYFEKNGETRVCDFGLPKKFGGKQFTETDIKALITGQATKPREYTWKDGSKNTASLILKDFKISFAERESVGACPKCGGRVLVGKSGFYCESWSKKDEEGNPSCDFSVFGEIGKTKIKSSQMQEIFEFGETKEDVVVVWKSGKQFPGKLYLQEYEPGKYRVSVKEFEKTELCKCPYCKIGTFYEEKFRYACDNTPAQGGSCLAVVPKKFGGSLISKEEAITLITKGKTPPKWFKNKKTGESYKRPLKTELDPQKGLIIKIDYEKK